MPDKSMRYRFLGQDAGLGKTMHGLGEQTDRLHSGLGRLAGAFAGGIVGAGAVSFLKSSIGDASDLNESLSKTRVVFGSASKGVEVFAKAAARRLGESQQEALEATSTFGNLFRALGIGTKPAADLSTKLVTLGADLASFNNIDDPAEVLDALKSGLLGEAEPLRKFGVSLSAARVEAEALADGIVKPVKDSAKVHTALVNVEVATARLYKAQKIHGATSIEAKKANDQLTVAQTALAKATKGAVPELTAAQKVQASYNIIMKDTKTAHGDVGRSSKNLAMQQKFLKAELKDASAVLGTKLLPVATKVVSKLADALKPGSKFTEVLDDLGTQAAEFAEDAKPIFSWIGDHPHLFTQIAKDAVILGGALKARSFLTGMGLLKGLTGGSALAGAGGALGKVGSPVPVFVTNAGGVPGVGGGKMPGGGKVPPVIGAGGAVTIAVAGSVAVYEANKYVHSHPKGFYRADGPIETKLFGKRPNSDPWAKMSEKELQKQAALLKGSKTQQDTYLHILDLIRQKHGMLSFADSAKGFKADQFLDDPKRGRAARNDVTDFRRGVVQGGYAAPVTKGDLAALLRAGSKGDVYHITVIGLTIDQALNEAHRRSRIAAVGSTNTPATRDRG